MSKNLVIVESPAKAKTIEGFLGKDFLVKSSYGHVRDLAKKELGVSIDNNFTPSYTILPDKKSVIADLKKLASSSEVVWLATDEDREGEAISWHLYEALGLKPEKTRRIVFNEITKPAILKAIENPRDINIALVNAQQARRILDRLVGFELSPVLWKKVKPSLSAGRVQSVAVRLIAEREKEIDQFVSSSAFRIQGFFKSDGKPFKGEMTNRPKSFEEAKELLSTLTNADFSVDALVKKPGKRSPAAPFTTSTLQQEASRKLGFSVAQTMSVAQRLYEAGKITYMRTDSVSLSDTALTGAKEAILKLYGSEYANPRKYQTKSKGAQEAHEAIRPTYLDQQEVDAGSQEQRLYDLIWKRTIASQMADAELERTTASIKDAGTGHVFQAKGEMIKFQGFLKVYLESKEDDEEDEEDGLLPAMTEGQSIDLDRVEAQERFTNHPPRYSEASLVKKLEELGIGRPSTYAPTISTIQKRGYIVKEEREGKERKYRVITLSGGNVESADLTEVTGREKGKLYPTDIGIVVNDFLVDHFERIMDYNFTASVEKEFDEIAEGDLVWENMISEFYKPFHESVETTMETAERASGQRLLGVDPASGKNVYARIGRFGPMVQIGETEDEEKPQFASIRGELSLGSINLEEALELFKLPKTLGEFEDKAVVIGVGRFGPYIRHDGKFVSLGKLDPNSIELPLAIEMIEKKRVEDAQRVIHSFDHEDDKVEVLRGRFGPYISKGKKNFKIPKTADPEKLTLQECLDIIDNAPKTPAKRGRKK